MLSKFSLSLTAALALSAAVSGVARAAPMPTSTDEARKMSQQAGTNDGEIDNPHSTEYKDRVVTGRPSTNDQINAAESGSPDSVDNKTSSAFPAEKTGEPIGKLRNQTNRSLCPEASRGVE